MTEREEQLIAQTAAQFSSEIRKLMAEIAELWRANAELRVERDSTDLLLGEAVDLLHKVGDGRW